MKTQTTLQISNGANPRLGNNVHARHKRDRDPSQLMHAYDDRLSAKWMVALSAALPPQSNVTVLELP